MDIQIESTPPKRTRNHHDYSTPPKRAHGGDYCTPEKNRTPLRLIQETPVKSSLTPVKGENPESKKLKSFGGSYRKTPGSSRKVAEFSVSRLDMDYIFERSLGHGNFSSVGLYRSRMSGDLYAIKSTKASSMSVNEAQALGTLSIFSQKSKNIIRYFHSWVENNELFLVMEYCTHNLASLYAKHRVEGRRINEATLKDILKQSLLGLKTMHDHKMVHLDIKPDNLLFKDSMVKVSDLGLARVSKLKSEGDIEEGDSRYLAKELLNYHSAIDTTKADIFSLGMTIYEGLTLEELPNNGEEWLAWRQEGVFLRDRMDLQDYSQDLLTIIEAMTWPDWRKRPSASEILQHPYLRDSMGRRSRMALHNNNQRQQERKKESSI